MDFERTAVYQQQKQDLQSIVRHVTGHVLRDMQCRVSLALLNGYDVFCCAATSSGKTLAFLAGIIASPGKHILVISPLTKLIMEQGEALDKQGLATATLTDEYVLEHPEIFKRIADGEIRVIWCGSERTLAKKGPMWNLLYSDAAFRANLKYVVVDEAHYTITWGKEFRPEYANIGALRHVLEGAQTERIPFAAMTATASVEKTKGICQILGIRETRRVYIKETCNRPNLFYSAKMIKRGETTTYKALDWLIEQDSSVTEAIPLTIVFVNSKNILLEIAHYLQMRLHSSLQKRPPIPPSTSENRALYDIRSPAEIAVAKFFSNISSEMKDITIKHLREGKTRVLLATEAFGVGMDIPNVERVIQWGLSGIDEDFDYLVQRFGRCARDPDFQGMCVLYYEESFRSGFREEIPQDAPHTEQPLDDNSNRRMRKKTKADKINKMDPGLWRFINDQEASCRRRIILEAYNDVSLQDPNAVLASGPCCDLDSENEINNYPCARGCNQFPQVEVIDLEDSQPRQKTRNVSRVVKDAVKEALLEWREEMYQRDWESLGLFTPEWVLTNKNIQVLVSNCTRITSAKDLEDMQAFSWDKGHFHTYGKTLANLVKSSSEQYHPTQSDIVDDFNTMPEDVGYVNSSGHELINDNTDQVIHEETPSSQSQPRSPRLIWSPVYSGSGFSFQIECLEASHP
ncbi:P-loop containing nucleoside triphosphate hydrolase protein [Geopyxis carbonaria]|nr:P-loop containing nucleoside triphosphate hydrolase protein [Geopyxis carbonaria]